MCDAVLTEQSLGGVKDLLHAFGTVGGPFGAKAAGRAWHVKECYPTFRSLSSHLIC